MYIQPPVEYISDILNTVYIEKMNIKMLLMSTVTNVKSLILNINIYIGRITL